MVHLKPRKEIFSGLLEDAKKMIPLSFSANARGISSSTLYRWLERGLKESDEGRKTELSKFAMQLRKIDCENIEILISEVRSGCKVWQSKAWLLERRYPTEFTLYSGEFNRLREEINDLKAMILEKAAQM
ncbi:MAG: hypothetical protein RJA83_666 [Pseudomonadota bacterium]|jgi:hypothetical protein